MSKFIWKIGKKNNEHFGTNIIGFFQCKNNIYDLLDIFIESNNQDELNFGKSVLNHLQEMPSPYEEGFCKMTSDYACACESINQLLNWFNFTGATRVFDLMQKHDLKLYKFKAETIFNGNHQVIYEKESVVGIKEYSLSYLKRKVTV